MKHYLLPKDGQFYKANLHSHSTVSDGTQTPERLKEFYMEHGYSIIAYTDHEVMCPHNDLQDENFLPLNGTELAICSSPDNPWDRTCKNFHMCCIALEPDNIYTPCYHSTKYYEEDKRHYAVPKPGAVDFEREYTPECINAMIKEAKNDGFFVTYNHPDWSNEDQFIFSKYEGMDAMEILNGYGIAGGFNEYNPKEYDALLRQGKRIYCVAADDNHSFRGLDAHPLDCFQGWVMIKADKLEYRTITKALQEGNFYASNGPEIHDLWIEDGELHITCSPAEKIFLTTSRRRRAIVWAKEGETVSEAVFPVVPEDVYVRITVTDHRGRNANTNAFFMDQL